MKLEHQEFEKTNSLNESILNGWKLQAYNRIDLRYPKIDLLVYPSTRQRGKIILSTFVNNKDRLILVEESYQYNTSEDIWEVLPDVKERFIERCELNKNQYIFNEKTSIKDPYK